MKNDVFKIVLGASIVVGIVLAISVFFVNLSFESMIIILAILFAFVGLLCFINYRFNKLEEKINKE